jgi:hypothetical protein
MLTPLYPSPSLTESLNTEGAPILGIDQILKGRKTVLASPLLLVAPSSVNGWHVHHSQMKVEVGKKKETNEQRIWLHGRVLEADRTCFQFWLTTEELGQKVIMGYVSAGPSWHQPMVSTQHVQAPFFIRLGKEGFLEAYRTPLLENEKKAFALRDLHLALTNFCLEANIRFKEDSFPTLSFAEPELPFTAPESDPLSLVKFTES